MKTEHSQLFQQFRSTVDDKVTTIEAQHDNATGTDFVLWRHVQRSFPNVHIVRDGNTDVQFMMDSKFEEYILQCLRFLSTPAKVAMDISDMDR
ncbi:hypothetical protein BGX21_007634 [Mortierella sp. AD011]|nr:hypothetical protein BGX21_007634 [Mortierella sp. AD011]